MASDPRATFIFKDLKSSAKKPTVAAPDSSLDEHVENIFKQAHDHRGLLIRFYVWYTIIFSVLVLALIFWQAAARFFVYGKAGAELVPEKVLYIIVTGMFGQFIGLLTIVTKKVWEFESFFNYANKNKSPKRKL
jgi:hypothetical protein